MNIATIIRDQIRALDKRAFIAWGAKDLVAMKDGLKFKTSGLVKRKCYVYVKYDEGADLYNVIFARVRKLDWIVDKQVDGVYVEDLVSTIDSHVG